MYLLTFSFVVIGMLGIYMQVAALEASQLYQRQTGIGQNMIAWHEAAMSLAENVVDPTKVGTGGCNLTPASSSAPYCSTGLNVTSSTTSVVLSPRYSYTFPAAGLPGSAVYPSNLFFSGYNTNPYTWYSIAFQNNGSDYVITYVVPPLGTGGLVSTAIGSLGITESDLYQQVKQSGVSAMNFGYVSSGGQLVTPVTLPSGEPVAYPVPSAVPSGSFGIISAIIPCNGC